MTKIILTSTIPMSLDIFYRGLLSELKAKYEVVALSSSGEALERVEQREGVRTIAVDMARQIAIRKDIKALVQLIRIYRQERPDMVHSITPKAGLLNMMAARISGVPVRIHTFTGLIWPTAKGWKKWILKLTDRITIACSNQVLAEGEGVKKDLETITSKPIEVLGYGNICGIDLNYYAAPVRQIKPAIHHFLFIGRMVNDKGVRELLDAFTRYYTQDPKGQLTLVGPMEEADGIDTNYQQILHSHPGIQYKGAQTDVRAYYKEADCLILPSYREGFPNVVLEAGAMALPCIVTDINGSREIIEAEKTGIIIPSQNSDALYQAMVQIASHPKTSYQMGQAAQKRVTARWERSMVHHNLLQYYQQALCSIN